MNYKYLLTVLVLFPALTIADNPETYTFQISKEVSITIKQSKFNPKAHRIEYSGKGHSKFPIKIDGVAFIPNDFDMPYWEIREFSAVYKGNKYLLDTSNLYDMWHKDYVPHQHLKVDCINDICRLIGLFGDAAGTFMVEWEFGKGKSRRVKASANEEDTFPLSEHFYK